jgi:hypothetical protein
MLLQWWLRKEFCLLGYNDMRYAESEPMFQRNVVFSTSGSKNKRSKKKTAWKQALLATCFMLVSYLVYSSTLKMKAECSYETLINSIISLKVEFLKIFSVAIPYKVCFRIYHYGCLRKQRRDWN